MSEVSYPPPDMSGFMTTTSAEATIADLNAKIAAIRGLQLIGNVTVAESTLLSLALGMKRMALPLAGVTTADRLLFVPTAVPTTGCEAVNVYASAANQVTVAYFTPALGLGATYSIPIAVYRITT